MNYTKANITIDVPNMLLIAGNGRNVGKTYFACKLIQNLSKNHVITGLKITPHFHSGPVGNIVYQTDEFVITEEINHNGKDSSLMFQAGANKVYFVMVKNENLARAFQFIKELLKGEIIICESGGLREIVKPGEFFFISKGEVENTKANVLKFSPRIVNNEGDNIDRLVEQIVFKNNRFFIVDHE